MSGPAADTPIWKRGAFWTSVLLLVLAVVGTVILVVVSSRRILNPLESTLLQVLILAAGLSGSYVFGRHSARSAAQELMKPAARSAFRRVLGLYGSLGRLADTLQSLRATSGTGNPRPDLDVVQALVAEQRASANDAMEDWRDLVPEDVAEVERRLRNREDSSGGGEP